MEGEGRAGEGEGIDVARKDVWDRSSEVAVAGMGEGGSTEAEYGQA